MPIFAYCLSPQENTEEPSIYSYILWIRLYYILHGLEKVVYLVKYLYMEQF